MRALACVSELVVVVVWEGVKADCEVSEAGCDSLLPPNTGFHRLRHLARLLPASNAFRHLPRLWAMTIWSDRWRSRGHRANLLSR